jgi:hypothetical protein
VRYVSRFGLQQEQQIPIFLRLLVVWKGAFLQIGRILEVARDFILLYKVSENLFSNTTLPLTSSKAIRFWISKAIRESRYLTSFSKTKFFLDCEEIFDFRSRSTFWAIQVC